MISAELFYERLFMKALSIHPEYAMNIVKGLKTVEVRTWTTKYRGDLLICATTKKGKGLISGHALGVVLGGLLRMDSRKPSANQSFSHEGKALPVGM